MTGKEEKLYTANEKKKKTIYDFIFKYAGEKYDIRYDELGRVY